MSGLYVAFMLQQTVRQSRILRLQKATDISTREMVACSKDRDEDGGKGSFGCIGVDGGSDIASSCFATE